MRNEHKKKKIKIFLLITLISCGFGSTIGYLSLFAGAQILDYQNQHSIWLYVGCILMWPTILAGYLITFFSDNNIIGLLTLIIAQLSGYFVMGLIVYFVRKHLRIKKIIRDKSFHH